LTDLPINVSRLQLNFTPNTFSRSTLNSQPTHSNNTNRFYSLHRSRKLV